MGGGASWRGKWPGGLYPIRKAFVNEHNTNHENQPESYGSATVQLNRQGMVVGRCLITSSTLCWHHSGAIHRGHCGRGIKVLLAFAGYIDGWPLALSRQLVGKTQYGIGLYGKLPLRSVFRHYPSDGLFKGCDV